MLTEYLQPLSNTLIEELGSLGSARSLFHSATFLATEIPALSDFDLVVVGVCEDRLRPSFHGASQAPNAIRKKLYALVKPRTDVRILDMGNISAGNTVADTAFALKTTLAHLHQQKIVTLVLGGSQDLMAAQYQSLQGAVHNTQLLLADACMDMFEHEDPALNNYLPRIIADEGGSLFNITQACYQGHFVEAETYDAFERMNFDMLRLGSLRGNMPEIEPYCRNAHMLGFSLQAIRAADAPGQYQPSPNGISADEACQLTRYAGMSHDMLSAGFYDFHPANDINHVTAALTAQMIWYFIEGYSNRRSDYPVPDSKDYLIYHTTNKHMNRELTFYKSVLSNRWWMEVPYPHERSKQEGKFLVPCSYKDYQTAQNDEIPDRWLKTYQKLI